MKRVVMAAVASVLCAAMVSATVQKYGVEALPVALFAVAIILLGAASG